MRLACGLWDSGIETGGFENVKFGLVGSEEGMGMRVRVLVVWLISIWGMG